MTTQAESFERLRTLYAMLAGLPSDKVDLHSWVSVRYPTPATPRHDPVKHPCGTKACAVGWSMFYPPFNELGLKAEYSSVSRLPSPMYEHRNGWSAVYEFFGLSTQDAVAIFGEFGGYLDEAHHVSDRKRVLQRIRKYLELKGCITAARSAELDQIERTNSFELKYELEVPA